MLFYSVCDPDYFEVIKLTSRAINAADHCFKQTITFCYIFKACSRASGISRGYAVATVEMTFKYRSDNIFTIRSGVVTTTKGELE